MWYMWPLTAYCAEQIVDKDVASMFDPVQHAKAAATAIIKVSGTDTGVWLQVWLPARSSAIPQAPT